MRGVFFSIEEFATFGGLSWCSSGIVLESKLIVNVKQLAFGEAGNKFLATNSTNFHKLGHERTPFVKGVQMQVCALRC